MQEATVVERGIFLPSSSLSLSPFLRVPSLRFPLIHLPLSSSAFSLSYSFSGFLSFFVSSHSFSSLSYSSCCPLFTKSPSLSLSLYLFSPVLLPFLIFLVSSHYLCFLLLLFLLTSVLLVLLLSPYLIPPTISCLPPPLHPPPLTLCLPLFLLL